MQLLNPVEEQQIMSNEPSACPFRYQEQFVEWMTALDSRAPEASLLVGELCEQTVYRLEAYQTSYLARVTSTLSDTLFEACENLFGIELVSQLLAGYFKLHPPKAEKLTDAPQGFPQYLRAQVQSREGLLFADLADVCLQRWKMLTAHDPTQQFPTVDTLLSRMAVLSPAAYIHPCSSHDLSAAWGFAQEKANAILSESIFKETRGVFLVKSSPTDFAVIGIPSVLSSMAKALASGESIETAIDELSRSASADGENTALLVQHLIACFSAAGLLTEIPFGEEMEQ